MRVVTVTFVTKPQKANPRLTFPKRIATLLGITSSRDKHVALVIRRASGKILLADKVLLRSGTEIYGAANIKPKLKALRRGEEIWVEARRPQ